MEKRELVYHDGDRTFEINKDGNINVKINEKHVDGIPNMYNKELTWNEFIELIQNYTMKY